MLVKHNSTVALAACSNLPREKDQPVIEDVISKLLSCGLKVDTTAVIQRLKIPAAVTAVKKADAFNKLFSNPEIKAIFDISGGDMANSILPWLNFELFAKNPKPYFGFSDNSVILNTLVFKAGIPVFHYFVRNISLDSSGKQFKYFKNNIIGKNLERLHIHYKFLRGKHLRGRILGGNLRCLLKLAGTEYWPDLSDKILFLESLGSSLKEAISCFYQLKQLGVFNVIRGLLLGNFSAIDSSPDNIPIEVIALDILKEYSFPVLRTRQAGHGVTDRMLPFGIDVSFS